MIPLEDQVCFGVRRGRLSPRKEERGCLPRRIIKHCILSCSAPASRPPACCGRPSRKPSRRPCGPTRRRWNWNLSVIAHAMPPPLSRGGLGSRMKVDLFAKGSPVRKDSPGRGRWHASAERGTAGERSETERFILVIPAGLSSPAAAFPPRPRTPCRGWAAKSGSTHVLPQKFVPRAACCTAAMQR